MKNKNSGFAASGHARPEIRFGDIYRDTRRGGRVVIRHVTSGNITYRREAYEYDCVMPRRQFERDFILMENRQQAIKRRAAINIKKIREMLVAGGKK
ncbi:DUF4222 domain-containing protein [Salmonella enterica subsp. enterica serovar Utah]|nr:DUF4222 domain-containing protein [Salmonella enterica subsp. enterica serovar Utah]